MFFRLHRSKSNFRRQTRENDLAEAFVVAPNTPLHEWVAVAKGCFDDEWLVYTLEDQLKSATNHFHYLGNKVGARDIRNVMECPRRVNKCVQRLRPLPLAVLSAVAFLPEEVVCALVRGWYSVRPRASCMFPLTSARRNSTHYMLRRHPLAILDVVGG